MLTSVCLRAAAESHPRHALGSLAALLGHPAPLTHRLRCVDARRDLPAGTADMAAVFKAWLSLHRVLTSNWF